MQLTAELNVQKRNITASSNKRVNDCCLKPTQQLFSYIMARTS